jgi:hypothetical protein
MATTQERRIATTRLPSGRAVLGAMLVATAAAAVLVAHRSASEPPTTRFVVLTREVGAGEAVTADDLGTIAAEVPTGVSVVAEEDAEDLVGRVARTTLRPMDLLRTTDLYDAGRFTAPGSTEVAVELGPAAALLDTVEVGDLVDVLSTDPDGEGTRTIARAARISAVQGGADDGGIGASGTVRVRLGVPDVATAEALVDAAVRTELTLALPLRSPGQDAP